MRVHDDITSHHDLSHHLFGAGHRRHRQMIVPWLQSALNSCIVLSGSECMEVCQLSNGNFQVVDVSGEEGTAITLRRLVGKNTYLVSTAYLAGIPIPLNL